MNTVWAQRREELLSDCLISPDVFNQMVDRLVVRRYRPYHMSSRKECHHGNHP